MGKGDFSGGKPGLATVIVGAALAFALDHAASAVRGLGGRGLAVAAADGLDMGRQFKGPLHDARLLQTTSSGPLAASFRTQSCAPFLGRGDGAALGLAERTAPNVTPKMHPLWVR